MVFTLIILFFITFSILGYSAFIKKIFKIHDKNIIEIYNYDFILGIIFVSFLSLFLNFYYKLEIFFYVVNFLGLVFFLIIEKKLKFNIYYYVVVLIFLIFITHNNSLNFDSPFYHLQIINWGSKEVLPIGLVNLENRYALVSLWHIFLSMYNKTILSFNPIFLLSLIPYAFFFIHNQNIKKNSSIYFFLSSLFILVFSIVHPFEDGIILNHLGSPEVDILNMVFFIFSFFFFLKFLEDRQINDFIYLILFCFACVLTKITYFYQIFLIIYAFFYLNKKNLHKLLKYKLIISFLILILFIFFAKNFLLSSCVIYPISFLCFDVEWSPGKNNIIEFVNTIKSFNRLIIDKTTIDHSIFFDYGWIIPWFQNYFLKTSILIILLIISFLAFLIFCIEAIFKKKKMNVNDKKRDIIFLCFYFIFGLVFWLNAPEVRLGFALIISIISILSLYILNKTNLKLFIYKINYKFIILFLLLILSVKNSSSLDNFSEIFAKNFNYENIKPVYQSGKFIVYSPATENNANYLNDFCLDFIGICIYKKNYLDIKVSKNRRFYFSIKK